MGGSLRRAGSASDGCGGECDWTPALPQIIGFSPGLVHSPSGLFAYPPWKESVKVCNPPGRGGVQTSLGAEWPLR